MPKQITLKDIKVEEVIIKPGEHIVVAYSLLDDAGEPIYIKQVVIKNEDYNQITHITQFINQLISNLKATEGI